MFYDCEFLMLIDISLKGVFLWRADTADVADTDVIAVDTDKNQFLKNKNVQMNI